MKVVVTGAGGFLGRAIIDHALTAGHDVTALVRTIDARDPSCGFEPSVRVVAGDLRTRGDWCDAVASGEAVIHAAAAAGGDRGVQLANTIVGTENLLAALRGGSISRFVHVSSFSVYDYQRLRPGSVLDENSPLEPRPHERDAYTETKVAQEALVRRWCCTEDVPCVVLRPGAIAGPQRTWGYGAALTLGRFSLVFAPRAQIRLIALANCAGAVVRALEHAATDDAVINLVDDPLTHAEYFRRCRRQGAQVSHMIPVPWVVVSTVGRSLQAVNRRLLGGRLTLPEVLDHRRQEARWKPLRYPNARAREMLGWRPTQSTDELIESMLDPGGYAPRDGAPR